MKRTIPSESIRPNVGDHLSIRMLRLFNQVWRAATRTERITDRKAIVSRRLKISNFETRLNLARGRMRIMSKVE